MSYRAIFFGLSIVLVFSAAKVSTLTFGESGRSSSLYAASWAAAFTPAPSHGPRTITAADTTGEAYELLSAIYGYSQHTSGQSASLPSIDNATLWLARCIYSETKIPHEQELVAWVVRNRVETEYRGRSDYKDVVLDPYQFSAFNPNSQKRSFYMNLTPETQLPGWQRALTIAHYVRRADPAYRPFSIKTRHFFSEISMPNNQFPYWVQQREHVSPGWNYTVDSRRFRFYEKIS
ncbi:hypothetical protein CRI94_04905 [Longibacter salinarum]|uniref:Uncharacterized protein n=1 Tax=Longibacter salinarum TaxID=1850348 RepID=A0A2A8D156_9BACT|nr:cell wall hydrolase [Longibacter salinarum]PEN14665.1 hypothetical protein CRI94_04905 [Longibacter salinarum]